MECTKQPFMRTMSMQYDPIYWTLLMESRKCENIGGKNIARK